MGHCSICDKQNVAVKTCRCRKSVCTLCVYVCDLPTCDSFCQNCCKLCDVCKKTRTCDECGTACIECNWLTCIMCVETKNKKCRRCGEFRDLPNPGFIISSNTLKPQCLERDLRPMSNCAFTDFLSQYSHLWNMYTIKKTGYLWNTYTIHHPHAYKQFEKKTPRL